jgi:hypothetical protein
MSILSNIINRLNQRIAAGNIFDKIYPISELVDQQGGGKGWASYIGNGQLEPITNFDAKQGTLFWAKRGRVAIRQEDRFRYAGCKIVYETRYPLVAYAVVKKSHLPCDSYDAEDWIASRVYKLIGGVDPLFKQAIKVIDYKVEPIGYIDTVKSLPDNYEYASVAMEVDVVIYTPSEDACYDVCETGDIPLPDFEPCSPCLTFVSVDGETITGNGTPDDPLVAVGGGGGGSLRVQDEGSTVSNAATTINFTGDGVTASLTSPGVVQVNIPGGGGGGAVDSVNGQTGAVVLDTDDIADTATNRYTNDTDIARLANTSGNNTGDQDLSGLVPYTGANDDVDLGANGLDARFIKVTGTNGNGHLNLRHQSSNPTATGQSTAIFADNNGNLKIKNDGLSYVTFDTNGISANRSYEFPDKSGTVAMTSDVQVYTAGSGINIASNVIANTAPDQTVVLNAGSGIGVTGTYPNFTIANTLPASLANVVSSNTTAANDQAYHVVANATIADPTPAEGKGYMVLVRNGTAIVGGTEYGVAGTQIYRIFHSGAWASYANVPAIKIIDTTNSSAVTGTTANTVAKTMKLSGGLLASPATPRVHLRAVKTGTAGGTTIRLYINDTPDLTGSPILLATFGGTAIYLQLRRLLVIKPSNVLQVMTPTFNGQSDDGSLTTAVTNATVNFATDKFLVATIQNGANGDSTVISYLSLVE